MLEQVATKLKCMETFKTIRKVEEPTDWYAGMVDVPKASGDIRVCTDFTCLNNSVHREQHVLPSIKHFLVSIQGANIYSKLGDNSGFHQIHSI